MSRPQFKCTDIPPCLPSKPKPVASKLLIIRGKTPTSLPKSLKPSQISLQKVISNSSSIHLSSKQSIPKQANTSFMIRRSPFKVRGVMMDVDYISNHTNSFNCSTPKQSPSHFNMKRINKTTAKMPRIHSRYAQNRMSEVLNIVTDSNPHSVLYRRSGKTGRQHNNRLSLPQNKNTCNASFDQAYTQWMLEDELKINMFNHD